MEMNTKVLSEVGYQLEKGNPWWGMALCNRYLPKDSPLRQAIALRFAQRIGHHHKDTPLAQALIHGTDESEIQRLPQALGCRAARSRRTLPSPRATRPQCTRLAVRERSQQTPRYALRCGGAAASRVGGGLRAAYSQSSYLSEPRSR